MAFKVFREKKFYQEKKNILRQLMRDNEKPLNIMLFWGPGTFRKTNERILENMKIAPIIYHC